MFSSLGIKFSQRFGDSECSHLRGAPPHAALRCSLPGTAQTVRAGRPPGNGVTRMLQSFLYTLGGGADTVAAHGTRMKPSRAMPSDVPPANLPAMDACAWAGQRRQGRHCLTWLLPALGLQAGMTGLPLEHPSEIQEGASGCPQSCPVLPPLREAHVLVKTC